MKEQENNRIKLKQILIKEDGVSILIAFFVLVAILGISLGIASLITGEIKLSREVGLSPVAYYAAEVGIEKKLYEIRQNSNVSDIGNPPDCSGVGTFCLDDPQACYSVDVIIVGESTTVKSYGCYKEVKRAIEASF